MGQVSVVSPTSMEGSFFLVINHFSVDVPLSQAGRVGLDQPIYPTSGLVSTG